MTKANSSLDKKPPSGGSHRFVVGVVFVDLFNSSKNISMPLKLSRKKR